MDRQSELNIERAAEHIRRAYRWIYAHPEAPFSIVMAGAALWLLLR